MPRILYAEFTKGYDNAGNRVAVNPRYDVDRNRGDVIVTYDADDTLIRVTASRHDQVITISQKLNDDNVIIFWSMTVVGAEFDVDDNMCVWSIIIYRPRLDRRAAPGGWIIGGI